MLDVFETLKSHGVGKLGPFGSRPLFMNSVAVCQTIKANSDFALLRHLSSHHRKGFALPFDKKMCKRSHTGVNGTHFYGKKVWISNF